MSIMDEFVKAARKVLGIEDKPEDPPYIPVSQRVCPLCGEVIGFDKQGNPVTVRHDCFRITIRYVAHHRTWMNRTFYLHDQIVADMTTDIDTLTQHNDDIVEDYIARMKLKPTEEEILLFYMSGIGATKIAALLGINTSTVWHRRHRIQMKYCKYIDPTMELYL